MKENLYTTYREEKRYNIDDGYEIAIIDPSKNNSLVGFWCGESSLPKGTEGFSTGERIAHSSKEWVDSHIQKSRLLKSFLKKNNLKCVRVKLEKTFIFNEM